MSSFSQQPVPRWLHAWAVLTVVLATALLALGGAVTTLQAGMADPDWPTYPWALLVSSWDLGRFDWVVEHSHRAAGYTVGLCVIVLAVGLWTTARRRSIAWLGLTALLCVVAQGVLGGMRVLLDESMGPSLKAVHGCFAQMVFSLLVGLAVLTGPNRSDAVLSADHARRCFRTGLALAGLVFVQIVWGVLVRHTHGPAAQRLHLLTAFAVVAAVAWWIKTVREEPAGRRVFGRTVVVLTALVVAQLGLGVEAWIDQYGGPLPPGLQPVSVASGLVRTAHVLVGAGILATAVVAVVQARRAATAPDAEQEAHEEAPASEPVYGPAPTSLTAVSPHQVKGTA